MTAEQAKEIILQELKNDMPTPLRNAMNMAVTALGVWDHYQDIEYDYKKQGEMLGSMIAYYRKDEKPIRRNDVWLCPACGKKITEWHSYCHVCGKKVGWGGLLKRRPGTGKEEGDDARDGTQHRHDPRQSFRGRADPVDIHDERDAQRGITDYAMHLRSEGADDGL